LGSDFDAFGGSLAYGGQQGGFVKPGPLPCYAQQITNQYRPYFLVVNLPNFPFRVAALVKHSSNPPEVGGLKLRIQVKLGQG
jgi:hypothetical protein